VGSHGLKAGAGGDQGKTTKLCSGRKTRPDQISERNNKWNEWKILKNWGGTKFTRIGPEQNFAKNKLNQKVSSKNHWEESGKTSFGTTAEISVELIRGQTELAR